VSFVVVAQVRAYARDALGILAQSDREHQRMKTVRPQVSDDSRRIVFVFPPAKEPLRAERALVCVAEPHLPIYGLLGGLGLELIIPFAFRIVAAVASLRPMHVADPSGLDDVPRPVPLRVARTVRSDLHQPPGVLRDCAQLESFFQRSG